MNFVDIELPYDEAENYFQKSNKEKLKGFFYKGSVFEKLKEETTYFLIGEKGSGKTAYSAYFCNNAVANISSKRYCITVDDYNKLIQMKKDKKLDYTHFTTLWKATLLIKLLVSLEKREVSFWGSKSYENLRTILEKYNFTKITMDSFSPMSMMDNSKFTREIGGNLTGEHYELKGEQQKTTEQGIKYESNVYVDNWVKILNDISAELERLKLKNIHYLFVDGIDVRPPEIDYSSYKECVFPLVRAVYELNSELLSRTKDRKKGRLQIILLSRLDIFLEAGLGNPGSKIQDNSAFIEWNITNENHYETSAIYQVVNSILAQKDNQVSWNDYFNYKIYRGKYKSFDSFVYFMRLTTGKPRDYIKVLKIAQECCKTQHLSNPNANVVESDYFQKGYSIYFVDSVRTALSFYYSNDEIDILFDLLKTIKKNKLKISEFKNKVEAYKNNLRLFEIFGDANKILELLFCYNMIGISEPKGLYRWKHKETTIANYNLKLQPEFVDEKTNLVFNWALEKEFGMYLDI